MTLEVERMLEFDVETRITASFFVNFLNQLNGLGERRNRVLPVF